MLHFRGTLSLLLMGGLLLFSLGAEEEQEQKSGLFYGVWPTEGFTLVASYRGIGTYLVDNDGKLVHEWQELDGLTPGGAVYLTEEGTLMRSVRLSSDLVRGAVGGRIREYTKDNKCIWEFRYASEDYILHQDFVILSNGNIISTAYQAHPVADAEAKGFINAMGAERFISDTLVEVTRKGIKNPNYDPSMPFLDENLDNTCETFSDENDVIWMWDSIDHSSDDTTNPRTYNINQNFAAIALDYLPERKHILLCCADCNEVFIITHKFDTELSAGERGDFLYRWGNPSNYGIDREQKLGFQHGAKWVQNAFGYNFYKQKEFSITAFNNIDPAFVEQSTVVEFTPVYLGWDTYKTDDDGAYEPKDFDVRIDTFKEKDDKGLVEVTKYSNFLNSVQKFPNGNYLAVAGLQGDFAEIRHQEFVIWKYISPYINDDQQIGPKGEDSVLGIFEAPTVEASNAFVVVQNNVVFTGQRYSSSFKGLWFLWKGWHRGYKGHK